MAPLTAEGFQWQKLTQTWRLGKEDRLDTVNVDASRALVKEVHNLVPFDRASFVHDIGTGSGAVVAELIDYCGSQIPSEARILATDVFPLMLDEIKERQRLRLSEGNKLWEKVEIQEMNAEEMNGIEDNLTSHLLAGYLMYALSDYKKMLSEVKRTLAPDGVFGYSVNIAYPWVTISGLISKVRPDKTAPYPPALWHTAESNTKVMEESGFKDVKATEVDLHVSYDSHEGMVDYLMDVLPFMPMLLEGLTEEETGEYRDLMIEQLKKESPSLPGKMVGKGLIVTGRK
ncbi:hypothetical protein NKR19_g7000 [Coniochaeta hoffmannii]|uniref:Methyltransferase type 11 domain-containing protein n=1 Tax=Coniochaeta hoffmannii TaxID=91930 RepID=A0AA38VNU2_9PEZI|nr:hypothetical protein NKR19_g7000 [Coniochaeta hoffmannii]